MSCIRAPVTSALCFGTSFWNQDDKWSPACLLGGGNGLRACFSISSSLKSWKYNPHQTLYKAELPHSQGVLSPGKNGTILSKKIVDPVLVKYHLQLIRKGWISASPAVSQASSRHPHLFHFQATSCFGVSIEIWSHSSSPFAALLPDPIFTWRFLMTFWITPCTFLALVPGEDEPNGSCLLFPGWRKDQEWESGPAWWNTSSSSKKRDLRGVSQVAATSSWVVRGDAGEGPGWQVKEQALV